MTISNETTFTGPLIANGVTTAFPFTFVAMSADEIGVFGRDDADVEVVLPSFTAALSSAAPAVGSITFEAAPADGTRIWIVSDPDFRQEIAFEDGSRWLAGPVNEANDRAAMRSLALKRDTDRAVKLPVGEAGITLPAGSGSTLYAAVSTLAEIAPDIETVAGRDADIGTVAEVAEHLPALASVASDIPAVAAASAEIAALSGAADSIVTLAALSSQVTTLAPAASEIIVAAENIAAVIAAPGAAAEADAARDEAVAAAATVNASITPIVYGRGAPDAMTSGPNGGTYIEETSGRLYGPKKAGAWPSSYFQQNRIGPRIESCTAVFFMGQSNADGWSTDPAATPALTPGHGYEYYSDATGLGSILPLFPVRLGRLTGGPQSAFAQAWAAGGGGTVVAIDCAAGGSSMVSAAKTTLTGAPSPALLSGGTWDQSDPANLYVNYFLPHMRLALSELTRLGFNVQRQVIYWSQGEQDALANTSQAAHEAALRAFLRQLRRDFPSIWFLIENLGHNRDNTTPTQHANIRAAQAAVALDPEFSGWVHVCSTLAAGFSTVVGPTNPDFSDTLHYSQARYNDLGTAMATSGLAFVGASGTLPVPDSAKHADLLANLPLVPNWFRCAIKTKANGAFGLSSFNDPANHYCTTFYDTSGTNKNSTAQTLAWTFPDSTEKEIMMYVHRSAVGDITITGTATSAISDITAIDADFPLHTINTSSAGSQAAGINLSNADLYRLSSSKMRFIGISVTTGFAAHSFDNTLLDKLPGLTTLSLDRSPDVSTLDLTKVPNLTRHDQSRSGLTVAEVNARLVALDSNGKANGSVGLAQYLSGTYPPAVPTGAGATAKANLQGKGWIVTTD